MRIRTFGLILALLTTSSPLFAASGTVADDAAGAATLVGQRLMQVASEDLDSIRRDVAVGERKQLRLPLVGGNPTTVNLQRFEVWARDAKIIQHTPSGDRYFPIPATRFYKGTVEGDPSSTVFVAVDTGVHGLIITGDRVFNLETDPNLAEAGLDRVQVREINPDLDLPPGTAPFRCDLDGWRMTRPGREAVDAASKRAEPEALSASTTYLAKLSIDIDDELFAILGNNATTAATYAADLVGASNVIYERDVKTHFTLGTLHTYGAGTDPWTILPASGTLAALAQLGTVYHNTRAAESRSDAILLSGKDFGGGVAWLDTVCTAPANDFFCGVTGSSCGSSAFANSYAGAYAFVGSVTGTVNTNNPNSSTFWDVLAFTHEVGHNFGSSHTHCIALTGADITTYGRSFVDNCFNGEGGCFSGAFSLPAEKGTIMSYCHIQPAGGYNNVRLIFGQAGEASYKVPPILVTGIDTSTPALGLITAPASLVGLSTGNTASIPSPGGGNTILWTISNGSITGGSTTTTVTFTAGSTGDVVLTVAVTNANGCGQTDSKTIPITCGVSISSQPASPTISVNESTTLSVTAAGSAPFAYQWYTGTSGDTSNPIGGATTSSLNTGALTSTTSYWVQVTTCSGANSVNSNTATVTVVCAPTITAQPLTTVVATGGSTSLSVTVSPAGGTYAYQWYQGSSGVTTTPVGTNSSSFNTGAISSDTNFWVRITRSSECGPASTDSNTATVYACNTPTVDSFAPTVGGVGGTVVITGTNLTGATSVKFNATSAISFTVDSPTQITATVPAGATTGTISVTTTTLCNATSSGSFTIVAPPTVSSFTPTMACMGANVTITGTNFSSATAVKFNGVDAASFIINGPTSITAVTPTALSQGKVSVTNPAGTAQSVANFTPSSGCLLAVTSLTATPISASQINLAWSYAGTGNSGYRIERKIGAGGTWTQITQTVTPTTKTFSNMSLTNCTEYYYRVRAYTASGNGAFSNEAIASTPGCLVTPASLVATPLSNTSASLTWTYGGTGHAGFKIERKIGAGGTFTQIASTTTPATTAFTNSALTACTDYVYRVRAYVGSANSSYSNEGPVTTLGCLVAPTVLVATPTATNAIGLSWTYGGTGHSGFKIERRLASAATFTQIAATTTPLTTTFNSTALTACTGYVYRVRAYNTTTMVNSAYSNEPPATTLGCLDAPTALVATPFSNTQINLSWTYGGSGHSGFKIERRLASAATFTQIAATTTPATTTYSSITLTACTGYVYRVRAYNTSTMVNSAYSNEPPATTLGCLDAPTLLVATPFSNTQINLSWTYGGSGHSGFKIERKLASAATFTQIAATTTPATTTYSSMTLTACTGYVYRVRAYNTTTMVNSLYSNDGPATTLGCLVTPANLAATPISATQINLSWDYAGSGHTGFKIERRLLSAATFTQIAATTTPATTTYSSITLTSCTDYVYRVRAYTTTPAINSIYSNDAAASTTGCLTTPTSLVATPVSNTQINLAWSYSGGGNAGFKIERRIKGNTTWAQIAATTTPLTFTYSSISLVVCTEYEYRVRAYSGTTTNSPYSNVASAATNGCITAPASLVATPLSGTSIQLTWTYSGSGHTGFKIERRLTTGVMWSQVSATATPATLTFTNSALVGCTQYLYRVRAYTSTTANSLFSNEATATTTCP